MKTKILSSILSLFILAAFPLTGSAQFDDVYYDPDTDSDFFVSNRSSGWEDDNYDYDDYGYDDEYYEYDDYEYYYSSRIRRFHRPHFGFGFYDPFFVDLYYYDPYYHNYYSPGASIYISFGGYHDYWRWRQWRRWNRWNSFYYWSNPITRYYSYNSWYGPNYGYWNGWGGITYNTYNFYNFGGYGGGYGNYGNYYNAYCPPMGGYYGGYGGYGWLNNQPGSGTSNNGIYYGPRSTGTVVSSPRGPSGVNNRPGREGQSGVDARQRGQDQMLVLWLTGRRTIEQPHVQQIQGKSVLHSARAIQGLDQHNRKNGRHTLRGRMTGRRLHRAIRNLAMNDLHILQHRVKRDRHLRHGKKDLLPTREMNGQLLHRGKKGQHILHGLRSDHHILHQTTGRRGRSEMTLLQGGKGVGLRHRRKEDLMIVHPRHSRDLIVHHRVLRGPLAPFREAATPEAAVAGIWAHLLPEAVPVVLAQGARPVTAARAETDP
jgi:hypothetical protein